MANITRYDPLDDFFRGFFVRPVEFGSPAEAPQKSDVAMSFCEPRSCIGRLSS